MSRAEGTCSLSYEVHRVKELWKDVPGYEGLYQASSLGSIRCISRLNRNGDRVILEKVLKPWLCKGYPQVGIYKNGECKRFCVHLLVLGAFRGARPGDFDACHNDGNPLNNRSDNLRWASRTDNHADKKLHGTHRIGSGNQNAKLREFQISSIRDCARRGETHSSIARRVGVTRSCISQIVAKRSWSHVA